MKQNNNRRARGRGPRKPHGMGGGQHKVQGFESGGQELRVRGNAYQVLEKYLQLARDAGAAGDRVAAENFLQHADHYYRVLSAMNDGQRPRMGGRELSVADVNVQNVSQGLSAALYNSGGPAAQGIEPGLQGEGLQGQNPGNQATQSHGGQAHGAHGGHRQGGHHGQQQHAHQQGGRSPQGEGQHPQTAAAGQGNGHGYAPYPGRGESQPGYAAPAEPARAAALPGEEQPDYPDELLPSPPAAAVKEAAPEAVDDGVQRTLRAARPRGRGHRRGGRQGDGRQGDGRQGEVRQGEGQPDPE